MISPEITEFTIVFVGEFSPVIIQPFWLAQKQLIQETEGENAKVEIIHNEITKFSLDWATIEVTRERFLIKTTKESFFSIVVDLASSIFNILRETPIKNLGVNHIYHYQFKEDSYLSVGKKLAPFNNWDTILKNPRLLRIEMTEEPRGDKYSGHYRIRVSPSELIKPFGVSININDHFNQVAKTSGSNEIITILNDCWEVSSKRANKTSTELWKILDL